MYNFAEIWDGHLVWIGLGLIGVVILMVTLDILIIPTMLATLASMVGWFIYLVYVYQVSPPTAVFLGMVFLLVGGLYLFVIIKLKLWKWIAHQKKVPLPPQDRTEEIRILNSTEVIAKTDLRPVGKILAGEKTLDGLSEVGFIPRSTPLIITSYAEGQFKVRKK